MKQLPKIIFTDNAGNTLALEPSGKMSGYNNEGELLDAESVLMLLKNANINFDFQWSGSKLILAVERCKTKRKAGAVGLCEKCGQPYWPDGVKKQS